MILKIGQHLYYYQKNHYYFEKNPENARLKKISPYICIGRALNEIQLLNSFF